MIQTQRQQLRCGECRHLFEAETPVHVPMAVAIAHMMALRCPRCGNGARTKAGILMGQGRTRSEDATFERGDDYASRVAAWSVNGEVGTSSQAIHRFMTRGPATGGRETAPRDLGDFRRCLLLLDRVPEWKVRMPEMASVSPGWATVAPAWEEITSSLEDEAGPDLAFVDTPRTREIFHRARWSGRTD